MLRHHSRIIIFHISRVNTVTVKGAIVGIL